MSAATTGAAVGSAFPDLADVPVAPIRARVVRYLLHRIVDWIDLRVRMPDGESIGSRNPHAPVMEIRSEAFFHRVGADLKIGVGEAYMAGDWQVAPGSDLGDVLTAFATRLTDIVPPGLSRFRRLAEPEHPKAELNDRPGSRSNVSRHYDLSNELFASFLDETMSYSAARFAPDAEPVGFEALPAAQRRKVDAMLDLAGVRPGSRVLEIGTGWGQLAIQAGLRGASVRTVTLSEEQKALAERRVAAAGLSGRVEVELRDYRDVDGQYDAVVSVEMLEAVGESFWPEYFATVGRLLTPGGSFGLQSITMPHERMLASRRAYGWVHKYVFPGGLIPSVEAIESTAASASGLHVVRRRSLQADYARTLQLWRARFAQQFDELEGLGFDDTFRRMWEFYLAYAEAGFRAGQLDVWQFSLRRVG